ncbi:6613_t:CDS:2 [Paraglomus occultum]|uniref:6613_t:CDS:1 n=1 Tax=Paraglomus occultum TaxID=144539 RepID=A0A9N8VYF7_9GLOM|nr:6613_t:CDS:2 [Paraglomus occultum]
MLTAVPHKPQKAPAKEFTPDNTADTDQLSQEASVYSSPEPVNSFSYPQNQLPTIPPPAYRQVKKRRRLTEEETTILNAVFEENSKPTQNVRVDLAKQLNMSSRAIQKRIDRPGEKQFKNQALNNPSESPRGLITNRPNEMSFETASCPPTSDENTDALVCPATPQDMMVNHDNFRGFTSNDTADTSLLMSKSISEGHKNASQIENVNKVCKQRSPNKRKATCEKLLKWSEPSSYVKHENCVPSQISLNQSLKYPQNLIYFSEYPQIQPLPENYAVEPTYMPPLSLSYPLLPEMPSSISTSIAPVPLPINTASISQSLSPSIPTCTHPNTHMYAVTPLSSCLPCHSFFPSPYPPPQVSSSQAVSSYWIAEDSNAADIDYGMAGIPPGYNNNINEMYYQPYQHGMDVIDGYAAYDRHDVYSRYNQCGEYSVNQVNFFPRPVCAITPFAGAVLGIDERHTYQVECGLGYGRINDEIIANECGVQYEYREYYQGY